MKNSLTTVFQRSDSHIPIEQVRFLNLSEAFSFKQDSIRDPSLKQVPAHDLHLLFLPFASHFQKSSALFLSPL